MPDATLQPSATARDTGSDRHAPGSNASDPRTLGPGDTSFSSTLEPAPRVPSGPAPRVPSGPAPREAFALEPGSVYLDAATYGPLPAAASEAMHAALDAMTSGSGRWIEDWDRPAESSRAAFADLAGVPEAGVALMPAISVGVGLVAAGLGPTDEVVVPSDEFTSLLFPLLVARERGTLVREVPFTDLAATIRPGTTLVATSLVQMQTGRRADLRAILEAAERVGARVLLDATQALPFLDPGEDLSLVDFVLTHGYKHLLCPRGAAFMTVRADRIDELAPHAANWRAADRPYERYFEGPLTLGGGARRFDVSLAWLSWVGAGVSLGLLCRWRAEGWFDVVRGHADRLAAAAAGPGGLPAGHAGSSADLRPRAESTLVCLPVRDAAAAREALDAAGIRASTRGGAVRLAVHLWNDEKDIARAAEVLAPFRADG